ncbi:unnamed protein product [Symbiodinium sp. CCMP2592]|nr:unnamed protein product [Symbiodinium sp. CCMP2592]
MAEAETHHVLKDLETDAISSPARVPKKRHKRGECSWFPSGPEDLSAALSYNTQQTDHLLQNVPAMGHDTKGHLRQIVDLNIVVTTCYSGTGCFEGVCREVLARLRSQFPDFSGDVCSYAATERNAAAQACLFKHKAGIGHIFEDVLGRLPSQARTQLKDMEQRALSDHKCLQQELSFQQIDKASFVTMKQKLESSYVSSLKEVLATVEFNDTDFCLVHGKQCCISPRSDPALRTAYWVEASGNTCCPWSIMSSSKGGCSNGWLDSATLPFLTWAYSTRFYEPDTVLQENVKSFPEAELFGIIGCFEDVLKHIQTRPLVASEEKSPRRYQMCSQVFSPTDLGVPSSRFRKYTALHLSPWVQCNFSLSFADVFFRSLKTSAGIYLEAVPYHMHHNESHATSEAGASGSAGQEGNQVDGLSAGCCGRLESWVCWSQQDAQNVKFRDASGGWLFPFVLVDLSQNARFRNTATTAEMPCLLTNTILWDLVRERSVPVAVHWLAQGFAHPDALGVPEHIKASFPFEESLLRPDSAEGLTEASQRTLTGNAMHWNCMGAWMLYNFGFSDKSRMLPSRP